ncbi:MAG: TIGR03013 family XrtA/PEP-CTERM system glycosyltransferase, partial [Vicinamibacteria bacterium]
LVETGLLLLVLAGSTALFSGSGGLLSDRLFFLKAAVVIAVLQLSLYYSDLYDDRALRSRTVFLLQLGKAFIAATFVVSLLYFLLPAVQVERGLLFLFLGLSASTVVSWHSLHVWLAGRESLRENVLILGTGHTARKIAVEMHQRAPLGYRVVGFLSDYPAEVDRLVDPSILGPMDELTLLVEKHRVNLIVVALDDRRGRMPVQELLQCRLAGVRVEEGASFFERLTGKILVSNLRPSWLVFSGGFSNPKSVRNLKRAIELLLSAVMLTVAWPLFLLAAFAIKLDSRGPVIYRQRRIGERGTAFDLLKFRTMRADAETSTGPVWASDEADPRVTRVGRILRKTRLDELPQLWNVLRGEMSFVGPRPERPFFVEKLGQVIPYYHERHNVKPGITGWAQVKFGYASTIEDAENKLQFDLFYIKNMSLLFDLTVILQTVKVMVIGKGAR